MKEDKGIKVNEEPGLRFDSEVPMKEERDSAYREEATAKKEEVQVKE